MKDNKQVLKDIIDMGQGEIIETGIRELVGDEREFNIRVEKQGSRWCVEIVWEQGNIRREFVWGRESAIEEWFLARGIIIRE